MTHGKEKANGKAASSMADERLSPLSVCLSSGSVTSSTRRPSSTAAATTLASVPSAAYVCPSWTPKPAWHRTTATSGWRNASGSQVTGAEGDLQLQCDQRSNTLWRQDGFRDQLFNKTSPCSILHEVPLDDKNVLCTSGSPLQPKGTICSLLK